MCEPESLYRDQPRTFQDPLLDLRYFHIHCKRRWPGFAFSDTLSRFLQRCWAVNLVRPVWRHSNTNFYSTFQIWEVHNILAFQVLDAPSSALPYTLRDFERILRLLIATQDQYLPEVRSDLRIGQRRNFRTAVLSGTSFEGRTTYTLEGLLQSRRHRIARGLFDPVSTLIESGVSREEIIPWMQTIRTQAEAIDPLRQWQELIAFINVEEREQLTGDALLAQDFYAMHRHLSLLASDLGLDTADETTLLQWQDSHFSDQVSTPRPRRTLGFPPEVLRKPYLLLEYLTNLFGINPRPRAIILTEGEEWRALELLYEHVGAKAAQLGIEFRPLGGHGNFSLEKWQAFIEYMHEKQVLVYFVLDKEGRAADEARKLLAQKRRFEVAGLTQVIPAQDRLIVWESSFEEANFTDSQIARAMARQGVMISYQRVTRVRTKPRTKGLINALSDKLGFKIDKRQLATDLILELLSDRSDRISRQTRLETFVHESAQLIATNHQPVHPSSVARNRQSGLLG